jgi:hypothetical protein
MEVAQRFYKGVRTDPADAMNLMRGLSLLLGNGARTVYAHGLASPATTGQINTAIAELRKTSTSWSRPS